MVLTLIAGSRMADHVTVKGGGDQVKRVSVDGKALPGAFVPEALVKDGSKIAVEMAR